MAGQKLLGRMIRMGDAGANAACREALRATWTTAGLRPGTISNRLRAFDQVGGIEATRESVAAYLSAVPTLSTRRSRLSDLRCCFRTLVLLGLLERDPTVGLPRIKAPRWTPRPLSSDEVARLMAVEDDELRAWFTLALYAGLRASEIAALEAESLERWEAGWALRVVGKGGVEAVVPAHPFVVELMVGRRGRLFPTATPNSVSHKAHYWMNHKLGMKGGIHRCRHTFATRALRVAEGDLLVVRDLLRHASVSTTQVYTQLPAGRPFEVVAML